MNESYRFVVNMKLKIPFICDLQEEIELTMTTFLNNQATHNQGGVEEQIKTENYQRNPNLRIKRNLSNHLHYVFNEKVERTGI